MQRFILAIAGLALLAPTFAMPARAQHGGPPAVQQQDYDEDVDVDVDADPENYGKEPYHEDVDPADDQYDHGDEAPPPDPRTYGEPTWRGDDGRYYCRRSDGATGTIIGGGAGALIGRAIDDGDIQCR